MSCSASPIGQLHPSAARLGRPHSYVRLRNGTPLVPFARLTSAATPRRSRAQTAGRSPPRQQQQRRHARARPPQRPAAAAAQPTATHLHRRHRRRAPRNSTDVFPGRRRPRALSRSVGRGRQRRRRRPVRHAVDEVLKHFAHRIQALHAVRQQVLHYWNSGPINGCHIGIKVLMFMSNRIRQVVPLRQQVLHAAA
jgi:hypothetical protein